MLLVKILGIAVAAPPTECVDEDDMDAICKTRLLNFGVSQMFLHLKGSDEL